MHFDAIIEPETLAFAGPAAARAEELGFRAVWTAETRHDPFLPLVPAALATIRLELGTAIAVAFPRSPTVTAYTAWDLARASSGRFILGLGTQVKAHIERRFSVPWGDAPAARLRDYIAAVRAVWRCWQTGERLRHEGPFYNLKLMTPFFDPGPLDLPSGPYPPIYIAGVNRELCRLAGEVCDGFHAHALHTARYLREAVLPAIEQGMSAAGRVRADVALTSSVFAVVGRGKERDSRREDVRRQIAFYASTPSYRTLLTLHGWDDAGEALTALASRGRWDEMSALVTPEMLAEIAVEGDTLEDAARAARARYNGLLDRLSLYMPFVPGDRDDEWQAAVRQIHNA